MKPEGFFLGGGGDCFKLNQVLKQAPDITMDFGALSEVHVVGGGDLH